MHKEAEAERAVRHLRLEWMHETGFKQEPEHYPSFQAFERWESYKNRSHPLNFGSRVSLRFGAEGWLESEIGNFWRAGN